MIYLIALHNMFEIRWILMEIIMGKVSKESLNDVEVGGWSLYLFEENIFFRVRVLMIPDLLFKWELRQVFRVIRRFFFERYIRILLAWISLLRFYIKLRFVI